MAIESPADFLKRLHQLSRDAEQLGLLISDYLELIARDSEERADQAETLVRAINRSLEFVRRTGQAMTVRMEKWGALAETTALMNSTVEPEEILEHVIDTIIRLTGAERAYILLSEGEELVVRAARNWDMEDVPAADATFSRSIAQTALREGEPILTTNATQDPRFENALSVTFQTLRSVLCVPLRSREHVVGVIYMDNRLQPGVFDADTVDLTTTFAHQAAVALENARRFKTVQAELNAARQQIETLRIQIDHDKVREKVSSITDTDYFQALQAKLSDLRKRSGQKPADDEPTE